MMNSLVSSWSKSTRKSTAAILAACLLLLVYIGFLLVSNYRNQIALRESTVKRFRLDLEKHAASLGYFFSERKYDLSSMAGSREVSAYFINKSLGMSEQYGLKVSLFVIGEMFKKAIGEKQVQGDPIYERFLLLDAERRFLVDTTSAKQGSLPVFWQEPPAAAQNEPMLYIHRGDDKVQIVLVAPCFFKTEFVGKLFAHLDITTLFSHFVEFSTHLPNRDFHLAGPDGLLICPPDEENCLLAKHLTPSRIVKLPIDDFSSLKFQSTTDGLQDVVVSRLPIHNLPLTLIAWVPTQVIYGSVTPWHLLLGTGSLVVVMLLGIGLLIRFNTQNLVLNARFEESERQQAILASKNKELEQEIRKRLDAEKQLEQQRTLRVRSDRLRSLGEMAAGIAHELNQPLVGVRGLSELILLTMEDEQEISPEEIMHHVGVIVEQADRMVHIINHVRLFARDAGKAETAVVDLSHAVQSGMSLLTAQYKSYGLVLESKLASTELPLRVNPFSLEEVVVNLLSNARDAIENRREREGSAYAPRVCVRTWYEKRNDKDVVCLEVADNGLGIAQSYADKVFDPFFTTKDPDKGTGLGLSICKSIVEGFGGTLEFTSTENEGTIFTVAFPAYLGEKEEKDEYVQSVKNSHSG